MLESRLSSLVNKQFVYPQALTVKLGRIKAYSNAERAGLKEWDYVHTINGQEVSNL